MFDVRKIDDDILTDIILNCLNTIFSVLKNNPITKFKDLINQKILLDICLELDPSLFSECSFLNEKTVGIFYAEIKEIIDKIFYYLHKSNLNFRGEFKELEKINISSLINFDKSENLKLVELLILYSCNCANKADIIDLISSLEEYTCGEIIKIVEKFIHVDEDTRKSIISTRSTIRNNENNRDSYLLEQEIAQRFINKIDYLEKEKEKLDEEKSNLKCQLNNLEIDLENFEKDNKKNITKISAFEEIKTKLENENKEIKKINSDLEIQLKRINQITKDNSLMEKYRLKLDEKEYEISNLTVSIKEIENKRCSEKKFYEENIYQLKNSIISLQEYKERYEKITEKLKDYEQKLDKLPILENIHKEYNNLCKKYTFLQEEKEVLNLEKEKVDKLLKDLEDKLEENNLNLALLKNKSEENNSNNKNYFSENKKNTENNIAQKIENYTEKKTSFNNFNNLNKNPEEDSFLQKIIEQKDFEIIELNSIIKLLENKQKELIKEKEDKNEVETLQKNLDIKEDTIKEMNDNIIALSEKVELFQSKIFELENRINYDSGRKVEELEYLKKENIETKNRYEKEFELIASSIYNLGLNYWSMKLSNTNEVHEKPSWLKRERKKYYDGDI